MKNVKLLKLTIGIHTDMYVLDMFACTQIQAVAPRTFTTLSYTNVRNIRRRASAEQKATLLGQ